MGMSIGRVLLVYEHPYIPLIFLFLFVPVERGGESALQVGVSVQVMVLAYVYIMCICVYVYVSVHIPSTVCIHLYRCYIIVQRVCSDLSCMRARASVVNVW